MKKFRTVMVALVVIIGTAAVPSSALAQAAIFPTAQAALNAAADLLGDETIESVDVNVLPEIRAILNQIIDDFPASDIAVKILFQDTIDKMDVAALDRRLAENSFNSPSPETTSIGAPLVETPAETAPVPVPSASQTSAENLPEETAAASEPVPAIVYAYGADSNFDLTKFTIEMQELAEELNSCYSRGRLDENDGTEIITFFINANGQLDGVPVLVDADEADQSGRIIYLNALIALESCGPYPPKYSDSYYEASFDGYGLIKLANGTAPESAWVAATAANQKGLKLNRKDIAEIQARLKLLGFDPNGIDGVMGRGSRSAIAAWQESIDIPSTGYLDTRQLEKLNLMSASAFALWVSNSSNKATLDKAAKPPATSSRRRSSGWYRNSEGLYCKRTVILTWCQTNRPRS